jgi:hypothetical protein
MALNKKNLRIQFQEGSILNLLGTLWTSMFGIPERFKEASNKKNGLKPMLISCSMISAGGQNDLMMLFLAIYSQLKLKFVWCVSGILHFYSTRKWHQHLYRLSSK